MFDAEQDDDLDVLLRSRTAVPIAADRQARVRRAVHAAWTDAHVRPGERRRSWMAVAAVAAGAMVAVAATWILLGRGAAPPAEGPVVAAGALHFATGAVSLRMGAAGVPVAAGASLAPDSVVASGDTGRGTILLTGGVELRFDRNTSIRLASPVEISLERGAVYVDTTARQGPASPITIRAEGTSVRDIGTRYEVRLVNEGLRVRVRDGRVEVRRGVDRDEADRGTELVVTPTGVRRARAGLFGEEWAWITRAARPQQVEGRSLAEFLDWVEREGGRSVRFADAALGKAVRTTVVYGTIDGLSVDEALDVVLPSCGLRHRMDGDVITIESLDAAR